MYMWCVLLCIWPRKGLARYIQFCELCMLRARCRWDLVMHDSVRDLVMNKLCLQPCLAVQECHMLHVHCTLLQCSKPCSLCAVLMAVL